MKIKIGLKITSTAIIIALFSCLLQSMPHANFTLFSRACRLVSNDGIDPTKPSARYLQELQVRADAGQTEPNSRHRRIVTSIQAKRPNTQIIASTNKKYNQLRTIIINNQRTTILWTKGHRTSPAQVWQSAKNKLSAKATSQVWNRLRNNFCLNLAKENIHVKFHAEKLKRQTKYLQKVSDSAGPYITHIIEQLEERNMPGELALLPMIESSFNPNAKSHMGATGLWQLAASTGKRYGLKIKASSGWQDPRKDVTAATNAALNYLQFLHTEFDGDWYLALAAYNAGEGRVRRAIKRNLAQNKPTDFWSLHLPKETKNYVPKLLALASLVKHAGINEMEFANLNLGNIPQLARYISYLPATGGEELIQKNLV